MRSKGRLADTSLHMGVNPPGEHFVANKFKLIERVCERIITPMVAHAIDVRMVVSDKWGVTVKEIPSAVHERGVYLFTGGERVRGYEEFWAAGCRRGAILVTVLPSSKSIVLDLIRPYVYVLGSFASDSEMFKGSPSRISKKIKECLDNDQTVFHWSASSGINGFDIFSRKETIKDIIASW